MTTPRVSSFTSPSASKKLKMGTDNMINGNDHDVEVIKKYLLNCPHISSPKSHPLIKAAIEGIEKEVKRQQRDAKLQLKFATTKTNTTETETDSATASSTAGTTLSESVVVVDRNLNTTTSTTTATASAAVVAATETDDEMMEWQDVAAAKSRESDDDDDNDNDNDGLGARDANRQSGNNDINNNNNNNNDWAGFLGKELAKSAIDVISEHHVKVKSPLSAIAVALHAALRSKALNFACTGIPENTNKSSIGFAAPVRELPKSQFLPSKWDMTDHTTGSSSTTNSKTTDDDNNFIAFRYRKNGTGAIILRCTQTTGDGADATATAANGSKATAAAMIHVSLQPANSKEPPSQMVTFPVEDHINLDSWNAARNKSSSSSSSTTKTIPPALHYKFLPVLLSKFCRTFDLGTVVEEQEDKDKDVTMMSAQNNQRAPYIDNTIPMNGNPAIITKSDIVPPHPTPVTAFAGNERRKPWNDGSTTNTGAIPSTLHEAFPPPGGRHRQPMPGFGNIGRDDLLPAGLQHDPRFFGVGGGVGVGVGGTGRMGGNLMGPNHPMFRGGGGGDGNMGGGGMPFGTGGPGTMQPRFDPIYPPGIDMGGNGNGHGFNNNNNNNNRPNRPSRGELNPDHARPPSNDHDTFDGMFS